MKIITQKNDVCIICNKKIIAPNCWVRYHVRYSSFPIVVLACKYCNWTEKALRTGLPLGKRAYSRVFLVQRYQKRFGVIL